MDGFSFSQGTNTSEVVLAEMESAAGVSRRGRTVFNDSYAPAEWSFVTYARPFQSEPGDGLAATAAAAKNWENIVAGGVNHAVEEALWANFVAAYDDSNTWTPGADAAPSVWPPIDTILNPITYGSGATGTVIDFTASNKSTVGVFNLLFELGACETNPTPIVYRISGCVANSSTVDFDIDGIAQISWSGFGNVIDEVADGIPAGYSVPTIPTITEDLDKTDNFIRNRLTSLTVAGTVGDGFSASYNLVLTGGSLSFENNITFLTPETLCTVNQPIGHVAGARTIGGSFTCYVDTDTDASHDLWEDLISATSVVTNKFALSFAVGGATGTPRIEFTYPTAHLEIPTHSIEDVISLECNFSALPSIISETDEATITYVGKT